MLPKTAEDQHQSLARSSRAAANAWRTDAHYQVNGNAC